MRKAFELSWVNAQMFRSVQLTLFLVTGNLSTVVEGSVGMLLSVLIWCIV